MIKYAITDPSFFNPYNPFKYFESLDANFVLFRDKTNSNYRKDAQVFMQNAQKFPFKKIVHQEYLLAKDIKADGVHLSSKQFGDISKAKDLGLFTIISTHSFDEIKQAQMLGADAVTFSPIFKTPNKGKPKGVEILKQAVDSFEIKVIALGGIITQKHIKELEYANPWGFASIRYFQ